MPTGFIYIVASVGKDYQQPSFQAVPTWHGERIYFGPCKKPMRPKMQPGDVVVGLSPSGAFPRRVLFAARIEQRLKFSEAYGRFPDLRGPAGPIHVRPAERPGSSFPESEYEHIPYGNHAESWRSDLLTPALDAFFVCATAEKIVGRWLGKNGPAVKGALLDLLRTCEVHGHAGLLAATNAAATETAPIRHGNLYKGLHLETPRPELLLEFISTHAEQSPDDGPVPKAWAPPTQPKPSRTRC